MKLKTMRLTLAAGAVAALIFGGDLIGQTGCGIEPIKPIPPIGCKDVVAQCSCDEHGQKCHWTWLCVKDK